MTTTACLRNTANVNVNNLRSLHQVLMTTTTTSFTWKTANIKFSRSESFQPSVSKSGLSKLFYDGKSGSLNMRLQIHQISVCFRVAKYLQYLNLACCMSRRSLPESEINWCRVRVMTTWLALQRSQRIFDITDLKAAAWNDSEWENLLFVVCLM